MPCLQHASLQLVTRLRLLPSSCILIVFQNKSKIAEPCIKFQLDYYLLRNFCISVSNLWGFGWTVIVSSWCKFLFNTNFSVCRQQQICNLCHIITNRLSSNFRLDPIKSQTDSRKTVSFCFITMFIHQGCLEAAISNMNKILSSMHTIQQSPTMFCFFNLPVPQSHLTARLHHCSPIPKCRPLSVCLALGYPRVSSLLSIFKPFAVIKLKLLI